MDPGEAPHRLRYYPKPTTGRSLQLAAIVVAMILDVLDPNIVVAVDNKDAFYALLA
jgi:hypothetical protein